MNTTWSKFLPSSLMIVAATSPCLLAVAHEADAQVRREPAIGSTISRSTASVENALFGPNGYFLIAGGVVLHGQAKFVLEQNGRDTVMPAGAVTLVNEPGRKTALQTGGQTYQLAMPAGLACPLARFTQRDGLIAYTILRYMIDSSPRALQRAGLARHRIAREFDGTGFEKLLHAADFAATKALPDDTGRSIASSINDQNQTATVVLRASDTLDQKIGSYINTDLQVTYKTYLVANAHMVEIAGVPLRYYWLLDAAGAPAVFSVEAIAQNWPANATLTDWTAPGAQPTQYDIVNFYQVAGVFRQLQTSSPESFARFADNACAS